jgi:hypothetical protein
MLRPWVMQLLDLPEPERFLQSTVPHTYVYIIYLEFRRLENSQSFLVDKIDYCVFIRKFTFG